MSQATPAPYRRLMTPDSRAAKADETAAFPGDEWEHADAADLGFDPAKLDVLAAQAQATGASCMVVIRHGRIAAEWYWNGTDPSTRHMLNSVTKSYTSTLVGIAQDNGLLHIDDPASKYIPQWVGTPSETVTIRQMLGMVSGRDPIFVVDPAVLENYFGQQDLTAYALARGQVAPPGSRWALNEGDIQPLAAILETATGMPPHAYATEALLGPIGDHRTTIATDPAGNTIMDAFAEASARDLARLGHLFLQRGSWNGRQVVSAAWVEEATGRPSQDIFPGYGLLWWLNRAGATRVNQVHPDTIDALQFMRGEQFVPGAPEDLFWAFGAFGQILQVHPATSTVVVRFGWSSDFIDHDAVLGSARVVTEALDTHG
jgi:CubicO group peptidase (beta-lactamase class C family)